MLYQASDLQPPRRFLNNRNVEVDEEVMQPGRSELVAQGLERHAAIARGERDFLCGIAPRDRRTA